MTDRDPPSGGSRDQTGQDRAGQAWQGTGAEMQALTRDWITLWQSELAAGAADRETQEAWQRLLAIWAQMAQTTAGAMLGGLPQARPDAGWPQAGQPRPPAAPRPAPAAAAPDARDAEIDRLAERVAELERRLAGLDRDA